MHIIQWNKFQDKNVIETCTKKSVVHNNKTLQAKAKLPTISNCQQNSLPIFKQSLVKVALSNYDNPFDLLINSFVSSDFHFGLFWFPLWSLLISTLISSEFHFGLFWFPLSYLLINTLASSNFHLRLFWFPTSSLLISTLVSSDLHFGIFWIALLHLLINALASYDQ